MLQVRKESAARRKILDTAGELFYKNGIKATGIEAVIEAAEVARMTLYHHFPTKEALVEAVLQEQAAAWQRLIDSALGDASLPAKCRILTIFDAFTGRMLDDGFRGCPFINAAVECPTEGTSGYCIARKSKEGLQSLFLQLADEMGAAHPAILAQQILILLEGTSIRILLGNGSEAVDAARSAVLILIEKG